MQLCTFQRSTLAAIVKACAKADIRKYLECVCFQAGKTESRILATTGHYGVVARIDNGHGIDGIGTIEIIAHQDVVKQFLKTASKLYDVTLTCESPQYGNFALSDGTCTVAGSTLHGFTFPNQYQCFRAVQNEPAREAGQFNARYLATLQDICDTFHDCKKDKTVPIAVNHRGPNKSAIIGMQDDNRIVGILMPLRVNASCADNPPAWACAPMADDSMAVAA